MAADDKPPSTQPGITVARLLRAVAIGVALTFLAGLITATCFITIADRGSPELASHWRATLEPLGDLDSAKQESPGIQGRRFDDGQWVYGFCHDSHHQFRFSSYGGTMVVKDSRGTVRAFFGHVCGPGFLQEQLDRAKSLDDFYDRCLPEWHFAEYAWR